jgi:hypothetical protein
MMIGMREAGHRSRMWCRDLKEEGGEGSSYLLIYCSRTLLLPSNEHNRKKAAFLLLVGD